MPIINVKNLSAYYENRKVFENVNFIVSEGDYLCIIGENGSGKTTLMKTLLGMNIKHTGTVEFNGFTKKEIGWLPQKTQHQKDFPASVKEVVMSGFAGRGIIGAFYNKETKRQAIKNMQILDIADIAESSFGELSGGQQQKVLLCRALCAAKKVLLLDEPVTGLDPLVTDELYHLIFDLNKEKGITVITVSHDIAASVKYASKILHLGKGEIRFYGKTGDYVNSEIGVHFTGRCCEHV